MIIDYSQLQCYINCPRLYYNKYIKKLRKIKLDEGQQTRNFGSDIHKALYIYFTKHSIDEACKWFKTNYMNIEGENIRTVANGVFLLREFDKWWKVNFGNATVMDNELQGKFMIKDLEYLYNIDMIIKFNGNIWVVDFKTTTSKSHIFFLQFNPNMQVSGYCKAVKSEFGQCAGFIPIAMHMGYSEKGIYLKDDDNRIWSKHEVRRHKQKKLDMQYVSGFWCRFDYDTINRNKEQLDEFEVNVYKWYEKMVFDEMTERCPKNENFCHSFHGCGMKELCISCDDENIEGNLFERYDPFEYLKKEVINE